MKTKTNILFVFTLSLLFFFCFEVLYLQGRKDDIKGKISFVKLVGLPDLAISTEAHYLRHRSLSDTFSLFSNSPTLTEFFPSTFIYNYSPVQYNRISRIEIEK